jgi:hypothetical protein
MPIFREEIPLLLDATLKHFGYDNYVQMLCLLHTG